MRIKPVLRLTLLTYRSQLLTQEVWLNSCSCRTYFLTHKNAVFGVVSRGRAGGAGWRTFRDHWASLHTKDSN
jgi:hypothetical protein